MTFNAGIEAAAPDDLLSDLRAIQARLDGANSTKGDAWVIGQVIEKLSTRPSYSAPVEQREAVARDAKLLAICRVLKPSIFARGLQPLEKDGPVTRATIENTVHNANKILDAILSLPGSSRDEAYAQGVADADQLIGCLWVDLFNKDLVKASGADYFDKWRDRIRALKSGGAK